MLKQILDDEFKGYDFLGHELIIDAENGNLKFEEFKSGPEDSSVRGLSKASLEFLAQKGHISRDATHVHIGDSRRVCMEGKHEAMDNYTAYTVAYFRETKK